MSLRVAVIAFPGSCDDRDAARAVELVGAEPVAVWHTERDVVVRRRPGDRVAGRDQLDGAVDGDGHRGQRGAAERAVHLRDQDGSGLGPDRDRDGGHQGLPRALSPADAALATPPGVVRDEVPERESPAGAGLS